MQVTENVLTHVDLDDFDEKGTFVVPDGIKEIDGNAFMFSSKHLRDIIIPEGVEKIGSFCFYRCENLNQINLPKTLKRIGDLVFYDCHKIQGVEFPEGIETIGKAIFTSCENLETVIIPQSVRKIGSEMFYGCDKLRILAIPKKFESEIDEILGGYFMGRQKPDILFTESSNSKVEQMGE